MVTRGIAAALVLAACGVPEQQMPIIENGDPPPLVEGANAVRLTVLGEPIFIAYRNGDSGWGEPAEVAPGEYELLVDTSYEVIVACGEWPFFDSELHARTFADGATDFMFCFAGFDFGDEPPVMVQVDIPVKQPAQVWFYANKTSPSGDWTFAADVPAGTHDMIAVDESNRLAIRRDIAVDDARTLELLDFEEEGTPMLEHSFSVANAPSTEVTSKVSFFTERELATIHGTDSTVFLPPTSMMLPTDSGRISLDVSDDVVSRTISAPIETTEHLFEFPSVIERSMVVYSVPDNQTLRGDFAATLPAFDELELSLLGSLTSQRVMLTRAFLETTGKRSVEMTTPPQFLPEWAVDLRSPYTRDLATRRWTETGFGYTSRRSDDVTNVLGN